MRIYSTMAIVEGEAPKKGYSKPARIICLTGLPLVGPLEGQDHDYFLNGSISRSVLDGQPPQELRTLYQIVERPEIVAETPSAVIQ